MTVQYPWIEGQAYEVLLLTATGATIDHAIDAAVETPDADLGFYGLMALIGLYVGVIPVAIGMLWLPWLRTVDARWLRFLLAFTIGLLGFLGIEALLEGSEVAGSGPAALGGAALVWLGAVGAYLALAGIGACGAEPQQGSRDGLSRGAPRGSGNRAPQPGGGARHRVGLRRRLARARRGAGGRLCPSQHHRGPCDRRARRQGEGLGLGASRASGFWPGPPRCSARGSARRPSTRASPD